MSDKPTPHAVIADSRTLAYEVEMLVASALALANHPGNRIVNNLAVEAFAIHSRSLTLFLWGTRIQGHGIKCQTRQVTEVIAEDFTLEWRRYRSDLPDVLRSARDATSGEVAHICWERRGLNQPGDDRKSVWQMRPIVERLLADLVKFLEIAPSDKVDPQARMRICSTIEDWKVAVSRTANAAMQGRTESPPGAKHAADIRFTGKTE